MPEGIAICKKKLSIVPLPHTLSITNTPRKSLSTAENCPVTKLRPEIGEAMASEFLTCPINNFLEHYMPFAPSDGAVQKFIRENLPTTAGPDSLLFFDEEHCLRFRQYTRAPTAGKDLENAYYKGFETIAEKIQSYRPGNLGATEYYHCPNVSLASDIAGCNNRTDACFKFRSAGKTGGNTLHVTSIAVTIEQKIHPKHRHMNQLQLLSLNSHIMNDDPRRMTIQGITVESDGVTIWLHTRSHSVTSDTFSFIQNPELLIKVFMAFLYATEEELGLDPMIKMNSDHSYTYEIPQFDSQSRFFRTKQYLSFYRSNNITGHMSRVWSVKEVDDSSDRTFVLKDVWLDYRSSTEKQIQEAIFQDITSFWNAPAQQPEELQRLWKKHQMIVENGGFKRFFLNIITDCTGQTSKNVSPLGKRSWALLKDMKKMRDGPPQSNSPAVSAARLAVPRQETNTPPRSQQTRSWKKYYAERAFTPRKQYRVVYDEVCTPFSELNTMGDVITALSAAITPLELLLGAGWIHRDISCGNVLIHRRDGQFQVKLGDLEYAKKFPSCAHSAKDPKTGTPYYMAHELLQECHLFNYRLIPKSVKSSLLFPLTAYSEGLKTVLHSPQHDLESLWWMGLRAATARSQKKETRIWAKDIFGVSLDPPKSRVKLFTEGPWIPEHLVDRSVQDISTHLHSLRAQLISHYVEREMKLDMAKTHSYVEIFEEFCNAFASLESTRDVWDKYSLEANHKADSHNLPLLHAEDSIIETGKRSRDPASQSELDVGEGGRSGKRSHV